MSRSELLTSGGGKSEADLGATAGEIGRRNVAAMGGDDGGGDGEPESQATSAARVTAEAVEGVGEDRGVEAGPVVDDYEFDERVVLVNPYRHLRRGIADRVVE